MFFMLVGIQVFVAWGCKQEAHPKVVSEFFSVSIFEVCFLVGFASITCH
jgi:hypothetical protein